MTAPAVTVLMTVYKGLPYLREAIAAVLAQSFTDFELLIVNDASPDDSRAVIASFADPRLRLIDNERNLGQTASLNLGLELARAPLVARIDQDDNCHPERLARQVAAFAARPALGLLGSGMRIIDSAGVVQEEVPMVCDEAALRWTMLFENCFVHSAIMFRRDIVLRECGGYDPALRIAQDFGLWSKVAARHEIGNLPELLVDYRRHGQSVSTKHFGLTSREATAVAQANVERCLGPGVPPPWLGLVHAHNLFELPAGVSARQLVAAEREMLARYEQRCPAAHDNAAIRRVRGHVLRRLAGTIAADRGASLTAWRTARQLAPEAGTGDERWRLWGLWGGGAECRRMVRWYRQRKTSSKREV